MLTDLSQTYVRWMIRPDLPAVLRIERLSFEHAWEEADFLNCLRKGDNVGLTAERGPDVVGFLAYQMAKGEFRILNLAVHPDCRRQGVGVRLVGRLIGKLSAHRRTKILVKVRESNLPAQLFFAAQGFRAVRVLRGFYKDSDEDAYLMRYRLEEVKP